MRKPVKWLAQEIRVTTYESLTYSCSGVLTKKYGYLYLSTVCSYEDMFNESSPCIIRTSIIRRSYSLVLCVVFKICNDRFMHSNEYISGNCHFFVIMRTCSSFILYKSIWNYILIQNILVK